MFNVKKIAATTLVALTGLMSAEEVEKETCPLRNVNDLGIGTFSGKVQSLTMFRDYNSRGGDMPNADTSTLALTLNYKTEDFNGFYFEAEYIGSMKAFGKDHNEVRAINDTFSLMSVASLNGSLKALGLEKTDIKLGRFVADYFWAPNIAPRQKGQYIEGAEIRINEIENHAISLGWVNRFSTWSTTDAWVDFSSEFESAADIAVGGDYGEDSDGTFFFDYVYTGIEGLNFNFANLYTDNVMNTTMTHFEYDLNEKWAILGTYYYQESVGYGDEAFGSNGAGLRAQIIEGGLKYKYNEDAYTTIGYWKILGDNDGDTDESLKTPFQDNLVYSWPLMGDPNGAGAGNQGVYVEGFTPINEKSWLWAMAAYYNPGASSGSYNGTELNAVYGYDFNDSWSASLKLGVAFLDANDTGEDDTVCYDTRFFVTYKF